MKLYSEPVRSARIEANKIMFKKVGALLVMILSAAALARAQQPEVIKHTNAPWIVSVVHTVDVDKMLARMREQPNVRVGVQGTTPRNVINVATGLVVDNQGHVVARLSSVDPRDKNQNISVTTVDGASLPAKLIGIDCATGFAVLEVSALKVDVPDMLDPANVSNGMAVRILSADAVANAASADKSDQLYITHSIKVTHGQVRTDSIYSKARGALTLNAQTLLSRNDGSVVTTFSNQVIGIAQYAGFGRAYLFPINYIRSTIAKRVLERKDHVPAGWLGAIGEDLTQVSAAQLAEQLGEAALNRRSGVIVKQVTPDGPAAKAGLQPLDIIVGVNDYDVTGLADFSVLLAGSPAGRSLQLKAIRKGATVNIPVVLGARPLGGPVIQPLPAEEYVLSEFDQVKRRFDELAEQYRAQLKRSPSRERNEALRELAIEIRQIHDSLRELEQTGGNRQPEIRADFDTKESPPFTVTDMAFAVGFTARDLLPQLAEYFGVEGGILIREIKPGSAAEASGIKAGDVIVEIQSQKPLTCVKLQSILAAGQGPFSVKLIRNRQPLTVSLSK